MRSTFTWKTWSGATRRLDADRVEFTAHHVVFYRLNPGMAPDVVVLAAQWNTVQELTEERRP